MIALISFLIIIVLIFELILKIWWPQHIKTMHMNELKLVTYDPVLGYICNRKAHIIVKGPEFKAEYKINDEGLRDESDHKKSTLSTKILLLGDSFTFGAANNYDKIWPVILEREFLSQGIDIDVVKAGVPFHNTDNDAVYLERIFPKYNPDVVILTFVPNNLFVNTLVTGDGHSLTERLRRKDDIIGMNNKTSYFHTATLLKRLLIANDFIYTLIYLKSPRAPFFISPLNDTVKRQMDITKDLLARMNMYCQMKGALFLVLSVPQQFQAIVKARGYAFGNLDVDAIDRTFSQFSKEKGFSWIPSLNAIGEKYRREKMNHYFRLDGHLNNHGNHLIGVYAAQLLSTELSRYLKKNSDEIHERHNSTMVRAE